MQKFSLKRGHIFERTPSINEFYNDFTVFLSLWFKLLIKLTQNEINIITEFKKRTLNFNYLKLFVIIF